MKIYAFLCTCLAWHGRKHAVCSRWIRLLGPHEINHICIRWLPSRPRVRWLAFLSVARVIDALNRLAVWRTLCYKQVAVPVALARNVFLALALLKQVYSLDFRPFLDRVLAHLEVLCVCVPFAGEGNRAWPTRRLHTTHFVFTLIITAVALYVI